VYKQDDIKSINLINNDFFVIKWFVTNWCNYSCSYCIQNPRDKAGWISENKVIEIAKKLNEALYNSNITKRISLQILGGEVTFYNWSKILPYIENVGKVFITTNFSNTLEYYKGLYTYCYSNNIVLKLLCSYHETGDEFFTKFIELKHWCADNKYHLPNLSFVVGNDFDFTIFDRFPEIANKRASMCPLVLPDQSTVKLNEGVITKIKEIKSRKANNSKQELKTRAEKFIFKINDDFIVCSAPELFVNLEKGYLDIKKVYCDAGINSISIDPDGSITRCGNNSQLLGNLLTMENPKFNLKSSICEDKQCRLCQPVNICRVIDSTDDPFIRRDRTCPKK